MTPLERQHIYRAYKLLTEEYVYGNRESLGTVGQLNLISAVKWISRAIEADKALSPNYKATKISNAN